MIDQHDDKTADLLDDSNIVYYEGKPVLRLNQRLITQKGLDQDRVDKIKELHIERMDIEKAIEANIKAGASVKCLLNEWTENQYLLQDCWKFKRNSDYHASHRILGCICAQLDNDDMVGTPYRVYVSGCPIHGENI